MNESGASRLFVAVPVSEAIEAAITETQRHLRNLLPDRFIRWTSPAQFHVTLKFIGDVANDKLPTLANVVENATRASKSFPLIAEGLGCFPNLRSPRVLWVGVREAAVQLAELQRVVETGVDRLGLAKPEGRFNPHITIGRILTQDRSGLKVLSSEVARQRDQLFGQWTIGQVKIVSSELTPAGASHKDVAVFHLPAN